MATRAITLPPAAAPWRVPAVLADAGLMLLAAFALRCWWFGNPGVQVDEQFYLLMGDRLFHGAVPFVDIWDRKPVGLFLVYAATRLLGGEGVLQYQLVATLFAAAAGWLTVRIARLHAGAFAARAAGAAALVATLVLDGAGGQSPVFYDPLVAGAALLVFRAVLDRRPSAAGLLAAGCGAMILVGLAIQFKYVAMFEGIGLGCLLLVAAGERDVPADRVAGWVGLWVGLALLPTALAWGWYGAHGLEDAFVYANFRSIGERAGIPLFSTIKKSLVGALELSPLIAAAVVAVRRPPADPAAGKARRLVATWLAAAMVGCLSIGVLDYHYLLPLAVPLAALAAPAFEPEGAGWRGMRPALVILACALAIAGGLGLKRVRQRGTPAEFAALLAEVRPRLNGCLYVYSPDPMLYQLTRACTVTRYLFPSHLNNRSEAAAIGVDPLRELAGALDRHPALVVAADPLPKRQNWRTWGLLTRRLARDYRLVAAVPVGRATRYVFQLKNAPPAGARASGGGEQFQLRRG